MRSRSSTSEKSAQHLADLEVRLIEVRLTARAYEIRGSAWQHSFGAEHIR